MVFFRNHVLHDVRLRLRALLRRADGDDGVDRADGHDGADDGLLVKMYRMETTVSMGQLELTVLTTNTMVYAEHMETMELMP